MAEKAKHDCHSTVQQAIATGVQMNAACIALTHFSTRWEKRAPNVDMLADVVGADVASRIVVAHDFMRVGSADRYLFFPCLSYAISTLCGLVFSYACGP